MPRAKNISVQTRKLLEVLSLQPHAWRYGYELSNETELKSGTLYPMLMRLEDDGLLESEWRPSPKAGRPPRHVYRLTDAGLEFARSQTPAAPKVRRTGRKGATA